MDHATSRSLNPLSEACQEVMVDWERRDSDVRSRHPQGLTAVDVLDEIRVKWEGAFPLCTWLDVHDEMTALYGAAPRREDDANAK